MATTLKLRRGTTAQHATFTGEVGEVTVDTDKDVVVVHDGSTAGGFPAIRAGGALGTPSSGTVTNLTGTASININGTVGATTPAAGTFTSLSDSGNLTFTGTGNRITGDFSNATFANRVAFQTSTTNGNTSISFLPNGTSTTSTLRAYNNPDPTNSGVNNFGINNGEVFFQSAITGTGTYLPMTFYTGGSERMRVDTSGNVGIGTTAPFNTIANRTYLTLRGTGTSASDGGAVLQFQTNAVGTTDPFIGNIEWNLPDNTSSSSTRAAFISVSATGATANNRGTNMLFATKADGVSGSGAEAMRIGSSGNVGIGTTSPGAKLHVSQGNTSVGALLNGTTRGIRFGFDATSSIIEGVDNTGVTSFQPLAVGGVDVRFTTSGTERARIDSSGNLLVGATAPDTGSRLLVRGSGTTNAAFAVVIEDSAGQDILALRNDGAFFTGTRAASPYNNTTASGANMVVFSDGTVARSTSSLKYKTDVQDATHGLSEVMALRPVTYKGKNDGELVFGGLIAEEVHEAGLTEFVQYAEDGSPDALAYGNMVSLCIKAIQEQQAMIEELKAKVAALEEK